MTGLTVGNISVLRLGELVPGGDRRWICRCGACGSEFRARGKDLRRGDYVSCGCLVVARCRGFKYSHGKSGTPLHRKWKQMRSRCTNDAGYVLQGVKVCERWDSFKAFAEDMAPSWKPGLTLERNDNSKGYSPDNCCWVPMREQSRNRSNLLKVTYGGKEIYLWKAAELLGLSRKAMYARYSRGIRPPRLFDPPKNRRTAHASCST